MKSSRFYYIEEDGTVYSLDLEGAIQMATHALMAKEWMPTWYGREVKKADPKTRLVFNPWSWTEWDKHWAEHLAFLKKMESPGPGRPLKPIDEYKHQRTVRVSDNDLAFIKKKGFTLQSLLDHAIDLERQLTRK